MVGGNRVGWVAQTVRQFIGGDMSDAGESVHPKIAGLCFQHTGDSARQVLVFPLHHVENTLGEERDTARPA